MEDLSNKIYSKLQEIQNKHANIENLNHENWNKDQQKEQEKLAKCKSFLKKYEDYIDLMNIEEFKYEAQHEIKYLNEEVQEYLIELNLSEKEKAKEFFMEIKTGNGGLDAQDWSAMLFKMYIKFFENNNIKYQIMDSQEENNLIKNITLKVNWPVYKILGEVGIHRLVRISPFNAQGKRQTSFSSVFIYGVNSNQNITIDKNDLKIETFRASGAGGQHVNTTDSAVRITHIPTKIVVCCQNERSQQKNKEIALEMLHSKLNTYYNEIDNINSKLVERQEVSWGQQFRSYVLDPYKIIKDNRVDLEIKSNVEINNILNGNISKFIEKHLWQLALQ